jgi:hypothetical protein
MAVALELMAEVTSLGWQDFELSEISNLQMLRGIVLEDGPIDIQVSAQPLSQPDEPVEAAEGTLAKKEIRITSVKDPRCVYYHAVATLQSKIPLPPYQVSFDLEEERMFPLSVNDVYRQWLFHGPLFQGITEINGIGKNGISAHLESSIPENCLSGEPEHLSTSQWMIDPVVIDSGLQLIILWAREHLDMTPLPTSIQRYRRFGSFAGQKIKCQVHIRMGSISNILIGTFAFFGEDGRVLGLMESMKGVCSTGLNRLSEKKGLS